nr:AbrB/MazE/SpoVT family DNA-binding domain-containing protein [Candidatus Sigynarchaeum springense]MDO8118159.1 AbrB/MazE/SpoVT family DNA-binding domain-containing protein [Candidatus Sigynarchaeota archaeon]
MENVKETTSVTRAHKGSSTLRITIPNIIVKLFNIDEGDVVTWTIEQGRIIVKVEKGGQKK